MISCKEFDKIKMMKKILHLIFGNGSKETRRAWIDVVLLVAVSGSLSVTVIFFILVTKSLGDISILLQPNKIVSSLKNEATLASMIITLATTLGLVMIYAKRTGWKNFWSKLFVVENLPRNFFFGILGAMLALGGAYFISLIQTFLGFEPANNIPLDGTEPVWLQTVLIIFAIFLGPVSEELFFRRYIFHEFVRAKKLAYAVFWSAVIFGAIHFELTLFLPLAWVGGVLALLYYKTKDISTPIFAHLIFNAASLLAYYQAANW